jgi:hypothetical protein
VKRRRARATIAWQLAAVASFALLSACAHHQGKEITQGAIDQLRQESENGKTPPSRLMARNAMAGAIDTLDDPAQQERIRQLVSQMVASATRSVVADATTELMAQLGPDGKGPLAVALSETGERVTAAVAAGVASATRAIVADASAELVAQLGPNGDGPLAASLSETGQRVSVAVAGGVVDSVDNQLAALTPECKGPNRRACLQQRLQETTHATAVSFTKGVRDTLGWQFLFLAFALGAVGGALGSWLWSLRAVRRSWRTA